MKKILLIDDEIDILKVVQFRLKKIGFDVFTADNGKKGLESALEYKPDLILVDLWMPFIKGDELCRKIKSNPLTKHIPVIIMTASTKGKRDAVELIGADDCILKPFDPQELQEKIKKLIGEV